MSETKANSSLALASLLCGVLSIVCQFLGCMVPMIGMFGIPLALAALITGVLAMQEEGTDKVMPGVGIGTGCFTLLMQVVLIGCAFTAVGAYIVAIALAIVAGG